MPLSMEKRYTADEFYNLGIAEPCELIDGYIYDMSPSPNIRHQRISSRISYKIQNYIHSNKGRCEVFNAPTDVKINDFTIVIPDVFVACNPDKFDEQKYNGAPDWVIEIVSPGNYAHDYKDKLLLYKNAGVREYWIIDPEEEKVLVYLFGTPNTTEFYGFDDEISAGIYRENDTPLLICVNELLK